jgi:hypothetical protein
MSDYNPQPKTAEWLNWALEIAQGLPYVPTARYVFYRLVQEYGFTKKDYKKFLSTTSRARKRYWNGWDPETFSDDTRKVHKKYLDADEMIYKSPTEWLNTNKRLKANLDLVYQQENVVIVCFEAKAMVGQFKHYLDPLRICQCAFGGDASIPYKYEIAELIEDVGGAYPDKPIKVLYFGDLDPKGEEIPENAMRDIYEWSSYDFEYIHCGLKRSQVDEYNIPDSPDAPGKFQWEAVPDHAAKEIIMGNVQEFWDEGIIKELELVESNLENVWTSVVDDAIKKAKAQLGSSSLSFEDD